MSVAFTGPLLVVAATRRTTAMRPRSVRHARCERDGELVNPPLCAARSRPRVAPFEKQARWSRRPNTARRAQQARQRRQRPRRDQIDRLQTSVVGNASMRIDRMSTGAPVWAGDLAQERGLALVALDEGDAGLARRSASRIASTRPGKPPPEPRSSQRRASGARGRRSWAESAKWRCQTSPSVLGATRFTAFASVPARSAQ